MKINRSSLLQFLLVLIIGIGSYLLITTYHTNNQKKLTIEAVERAMNYARETLSTEGEITLKSDQLYAGSTGLAGSTDLVDKVKAITGFGCTIFKGNVRISTTATAEGTDELAVGTTANAEITQKVLGDGEIFEGVTETIGKKWLIIYEPLKNRNGETVGMLAVFRAHEQFMQNLNEFKLLVAGTILVFVLFVLFLLRRIQGSKSRLMDATAELSNNHQLVLDQKEELERLIFVVDEIEQAIAIVDRHDRIEWINKSFQKKLQYSLEEAVGNKISEIVGGPETDRLTIKKMDEAIFWRKKPIDSTVLQYRKDGTSYWARVYLSPLFDDEQEIKGYVAISLDITTEKEAIESLKESEANIRQIGETIEDMVYLYNITYRKYEYISPKCSTVLGVNQSFFYSGLSYKEIYVKDKHKIILKTAEEKLHKGEPYDIEYEIEVDNETRWVRERSQPIFNDKGEIIKQSGICSDITKRKRVENQLNRSHDYMKILSHVGLETTQELSFLKMIDNVHKHISTVMDADCFSIGVLQDNDILFPKFIEKTTVYENIIHSMDEHILATICLKENKPIIIKDFFREIKQYSNKTLNDTDGDIPQSIVYLPLEFRGNLLGVVTVQSLRKYAYDKERIALLKSLSVYIANGIANIQVHDDLTKSLPG